MEIDLTRMPRIARLLGRIDESRRVASELPEGHAGRVDLDARVARLYAEVGRYVHWLLRQDPEAVERLRVEGLRWADAIDAELGLVPLPAELSVPVTSSRDDEHEPSVAPSLELTADSRLAVVDVRDLQDADVAPLTSGKHPAVRSVPVAPEEVDAARPAHPPAAEAEPLAVGDEADVEDLAAPVVDEPDEDSADLEAVDDDLVEVLPREGDTDDDAAVEAVAEERGDASPETHWLTSLGDVLEGLGEPAPLPTAPKARAALVRGIVVATTNFEVHWSIFPDPVQQSLLGMLGGRVRRLEAVLDGDPDLRLAIGRLRRFAEQRGLVLAPSLRATPAAGRDWFADELRYWNVLRAGL